jgi:hypothetical protein
MRCTDDHDHFRVRVNVEIKKDTRGGYTPGELLTYGQEFDIPATGFTGVAEILGHLDLAIGAIHRCGKA